MPKHMFNMVATRVVRINRTLYVRVPADEARRLNLREGQTVDVDVRPLRPPAREAAARLFGTAPRLKPFDRAHAAGDRAGRVGL